ncbi:RagB/SusD family nutrient uptake outer membrane protein [Muricauda sp. CAU 1633]|uniref:RagB/SusD family nutrient uptake outer membrane protein n=1 Tax=Allomuricauda sp. CAU 1633 TaxID=2816036 RepID=UPI001A8C39CD|nr:RagB/SusD family nutrient uptake outer membrane protein [Muricauda sp. CAU 1633]MBO0321519.1 RagB/SusD family nutrient uptake outer membrane protein [Muricauda sp. CAU 1633]
MIKFSIHKKYKSWILVMLMALCLTNCSDLEENVYSQVNVSEFYTTEDQAQLALNGVYSIFLGGDIYRDGIWTTLGDVTAFTLKGGGSANGSGDRSGVDNEWNTYTWTADALEFSTEWNSNFGALNRANTLIDKVEGSSISESAKSNIIGQAKFMRAFIYFDLVKLFGGVPIYTNGTSDLSLADIPRNSQEEVYAQIISDLQDAQSALSPFNASEHALGKASYASATALLAKVYLQQRNWQAAAQEAKKVIDMNQFALQANYENTFNPDTQNGSEQIFSIQAGGTGNENSQIYQTRFIYLAGPPAQNLSDGRSVIFHSLKDVVIYQADQDFFNATPDTYRKWWTMREKMPYYYLNSVSEANLVMDTVQMYAPFLLKYHRINFSSGTLREGVNFPIIRYSDVLLIYAEALNEANGGPSAEAYNAINSVRRRARAVGTTSEQPESTYPDLSGLSQGQFRDAVLDEYAREFAGEGHFRYDLLRHDRLISHAQANGASAAEEKHKLFPIPSTQTSVNENLVQNPGY